MERNLSFIPSIFRQCHYILPHPASAMCHSSFRPKAGVDHWTEAATVKKAEAARGATEGLLWTSRKLEWNLKPLFSLSSETLYVTFSFQFPWLFTPPADLLNLWFLFRLRKTHELEQSWHHCSISTGLWFSVSKVLNLCLNHHYIFSLCLSLASILWRWVIGVPWENFLTKFKPILLQEGKCGCLSSSFSESCCWGQRSNLLGEMNSLLSGAILNSLVVRTSAMTSPSPSPMCASGFCRSYLCLYLPFCTWHMCSM